MKWIKTTNRLPSVENNYYVKYSKHAEYRKLAYFNGRAFVDNDWQQPISEWLDETNPNLTDKHIDGSLIIEEFLSQQKDTNEKLFNVIEQIIDKELSTNITDTQRLDWLENFISHYNWEYMLGINLREFVDKRLRNETETE